MASKGMTIGLIIGGLFLAMCVLCVGGLVWLVSAGVDAAGDFVAAEAARTEFAANWNPPAEDVDGADLFPAQAGAFALESQDADANVPEFNVEAEGWHGVYKSGGATVQVYAYVADFQTKETLFARIAAAADDESKYNMRTNTRWDPNRFNFSVSPPAQNGYLWYSKGWMFFFLGSGDPDLDAFSVDYLTLVQP